MKYRSLLAIIIISLCASVSVSAQKINKTYVTKNTDKGTLYFIMPIDGLFGNGKYNSVTMDITHTAPGDSVRINYTFIQPTFSAVDSVALNTAGKEKVFAVEKLYVEPAKKSMWLHRYGFNISKNEVREFFSGATPSSILIYSNGKTIEYSAADSKKRKDKTVIINSVFDIIENNK